MRKIKTINAIPVQKVVPAVMLHEVYLLFDLFQFVTKNYLKFKKSFNSKIKWKRKDKYELHVSLFAFL